MKISSEKNDVSFSTELIFILSFACGCVLEKLQLVSFSICPKTQNQILQDMGRRGLKINYSKWLLLTVIARSFEIQLMVMSKKTKLKMKISSVKNDT